jgi:hypothetical protein
MRRTYNGRVGNDFGGSRGGLGGRSVREALAIDESSTFVITVGGRSYGLPSKGLVLGDASPLPC